jgi:rhodanese-related sulfurtransferase
VRQPEEYERGHLPGAELIPVGELEKRLKELDPSKPTISY